MLNVETRLVDDDGNEVPVGEVGEVEEAIYTHPDVAEVAVFALADPKWIEAVTATVVAREGSTLSVESLQEHCAGILAPYKRPKRIEILTELPKNPSGKILKRELRERFS